MRRRRAQILVFTVLILLVISLAVISITVTTSRNSRQVFSNLEYEKSYNYAEAETIANISTLSNPNLDAGDLATSGLGELECRQTSDKLVCSRSLDENTRRVVLSISESNKVENYDLAVGDYFDVVLGRSSSNNFYKGSLEFRWIGETAFDISLIYLDNTNKMRIAHEIIDPNSVYTSSSTGFLNTRPIVQDNSLTIDLTQVKTAVVPATSKYLYLRIKSVNRDFGTSITIRPASTGSTSLPNQVRRIEAFSYLTETPESAAPVVLTQLPLSPQVPTNFTFALNSDANRQPICGDTVKEGREQCDDGNSNNNDGCNNQCQLQCRVLIAGYDLCEYGGCYVTQFVASLGRPGYSKQLSYVGNYLNNPTAFDALRADQYEIIVYAAFGYEFTTSAKQLNEAVAAGKKIVIVNDGGPFVGTANPLLAHFGMGIGGDGILGTHVLSKAPGGKAVYGGNQTMLLTTEGSVGGIPVANSTFACQYYSPTGNCVWADRTYNNGAVVSVIASAGIGDWPPGQGGADASAKYSLLNGLCAQAQAQVN
jgi:cysteine-rich repeat protein